MASPLDVMRTIQSSIVGYLAPLQPNLITAPNPAPTAGTIHSTGIAVGYPVQVKVTQRLENKQNQVAVYEGSLEQKIPHYLNEYIPIPGTSNFEVARSNKQIIVSVWSFSLQERDLIVSILRQNLRDFWRQKEQDGSITFVRYVQTIPRDFEQTDSMWVSEMYFMADHSVTITEQTYLITQIDLTTTINDGPPIEEIIT